MNEPIFALLTLTATLAVHLAAMIWWAATLTKRVDHIEKWIASNEHTAARIAALEQDIEHVSSGVARIEHHLRNRK